MSPILRTVVRVADILAIPFVAVAGTLLRAVRRIGLHRLPASRYVLRGIGVLPIRDHYYEPLINPRHLRFPLDCVRTLPGIKFDEAAQLAFVAQLRYGDEWQDVLRNSSRRAGEYRLENEAFGAGDADFWYSVVRYRKPKCIVEVGGGFSTLVARRAIDRNAAEDLSYSCRHICVEPYEMSWLESTGVEVLRQRVEDVDRALFTALGPGDVLFIDSSHVIRPQGDVLTEYLEILPTIPPGVLVHVHDIFTPRDYPARWIEERMLLWNEQYLLEAFLTCNPHWRIVAALNHLYRTHFEALRSACPCLSPVIEPGSIYLERIN